MHDSYAVDIKMEQHYGLHHDDDFATAAMVQVAPDSPHHSPPNDYGDFDFSTSVHAQLDSMYNRPLQSAFPTPQPLHPLITMPQWPSQITSPSETSSPPPVVHLQPRPILPLSKTVPTIPKLATVSPKEKPTQSSSRRTLTDSDRRKMCEYHNENPNVKQTEIGAMFGVERSTVSKVLRNKDKYLVQEEGNRSPIRRSKSKFPDIERTLSQWVKNRISQRLPLDDSTIRDQARIFATTVGSSECHNQVNDPAWLELFKQKNHLPGAKPSEIKDENDALCPETKSGSQTPNGISPVGWDGLPISPPKEEFNAHSPDNYIDSNNNYGHAHSQSATSLGSCFSEISSFAGDFRSPTSPYFSPMSSCGPSPSMPAQKMARLPPLAPAGALRRRQTVPLISSDSSPDSTASKPLPQSMASSTLDSPHDEMDISPLSATDPSLHPSRSSTSNPSPLSMAPPSSMTLGSSNPSSAVSASPLTSNNSPSSPPSQDEARAALSTLMTFIKHQPNGAVDPHDYLVMGKWMHMLKLETGELPGGMQAIHQQHPMQGSERADGTVPIGRKRSEHSLS
ncbi:hypothetical protein HO133_000730 [Letharia lupina]|uniref:HTH CENPB-type domain-containing protein n=1 Tax=Letharia lupina TaxID=560253 RepID=A0A8H6CFY9_9LECA|nr:uncharacterized protein HO133_000730 [Letharia lupina]KAF6222683.1 hypothetical protein HO133_000730 [Letharia lupina]